MYRVNVRNFFNFLNHLGIHVSPIVLCVLLFMSATILPFAILTQQ